MSTGGGEAVRTGDHAIEKGRGQVGLLGLIRRGRHERAGFELYGTAVAAARDPYFYITLDVPDTLDGRFDLIGLHVFLVIQRLTDEVPLGPPLAQAVFDAMFSDMDINLREMGVGDLSVGRRVKAMWDAFHGRANAYTAALRDVDPAALENALGRNIWRGETPPPGSTPALGRLVRQQITCLAGQDLSALLAGTVRFLPAAEAAR